MDLYAIRFSHPGDSVECIICENCHPLFDSHLSAGSVARPSRFDADVGIFELCDECGEYVDYVYDLGCIEPSL